MSNSRAFRVRWKKLLVFLGKEAGNFGATGGAGAFRHSTAIGGFLNFAVRNGFLFATFDAVPFKFHDYLLSGFDGEKSSPPFIWNYFNQSAQSIANLGQKDNMSGALTLQFRAKRVDLT